MSVAPLADAVIPLADDVVKLPDVLISPVVIADPETLFAVVICASCVSTIPAEALISVVVIVPLAISVVVTAPEAIVGFGYVPVKLPPADPPGAGLFQVKTPKPSVTNTVPLAPSALGNCQTGLTEPAVDGPEKPTYLLPVPAYKRTVPTAAAAPDTKGPALAVMPLLEVVEIAPEELMAVVPAMVPEVMALPDTLPAVLIVASCVSTIPAVALISVVVIVPLAISVVVTA